MLGPLYLSYFVRIRLKEICLQGFSFIFIMDHVFSQVWARGSTWRLVEGRREHQIMHQDVQAIAQTLFPSTSHSDVHITPVYPEDTRPAQENDANSPKPDYKRSEAYIKPDKPCVTSTNTVQSDSCRLAGAQKSVRDLQIRSPEHLAIKITLE